MVEDVRQPTIVLVHGAFAESSSWDGVVRRLLAERFPVVAFANPLRGVAHDATQLAALVSGIDGEVVLVAHSYGGMLISNVDDDRVRSRVFVGAFCPERGESASDLASRFPGSTLAETLEQTPLPDGGTDLRIRQDRYRAQFAADSPPEDAAVLAATQRPITAAALDEPSAAAAWRSSPNWFLFGSDDRNIPAAAHRSMAARADARATVEIDGGSHAVAIPEAVAVARLIRDAAGTAEPE